MSNTKDPNAALHDEFVAEEKEKELEELPDDVHYDEAETKRLLRKVDVRLLPVLTMLYLMSFLDRSNSEH